MPKTYSEKTKASIKDAVVDWIAEGKTLREFCRQDGMPSYGAIYDWEEIDKDFATRIARARLVGEDVIAQECMAIADDSSRDWVETDEGKAFDREHVQRSKLRIETRLKLLAKWNPRKYGDLTKLEHTGADGGPIQHEVRPFTAMYADMGKEGNPSGITSGILKTSGTPNLTERWEKEE